MPVPQMTTSVRPSSFASWNFRIMAGRTCELARSKLSLGPYRFVGMAEMKLEPYCLRYAWQSLMPAIFAIAYGSVAHSSPPVRRGSSPNAFGATPGEWQGLPGYRSFWGPRSG